MLDLKNRLDWLRSHLRRLLESPTDELSRWGRLAVYQIRLWRFCGRQLRRDHLVTVAGDLTFKTLLSFIPIFVIFLLIVSAFSPGAELEQKVQDWLLGAVQVDSIRMTVGDREVGLSEYIEALVAAARRRMDAAAITGIIFLFVLAINVLVTIESAVSRIWNIEKRRPLWRKLVMFWVVLTLGPLVVALAVYLSGSLTERAEPLQPWLIAAGEWSVGLGATWLVLFIFYKLLPHREVHWRSAMTGAVVAGTLWHVIAKLALGIYIEHATGYGQLYGNLAVVPVFLLWIYFTWIIVLFGAELAYVVQNFRGLARAEAEQQERQRARFVAGDFAALVAAAVCARRFRRGEGPTPLDVLMDATGLGRSSLEELLGQLEAAHLLVRTPAAERDEADPAYLPARELDQVTVAEVLRAAKCHLPTPADPNHLTLHREIRAVYETARGGGASATGRTTLADLIAGIPPPPATGCRTFNV